MGSKEMRAAVADQMRRWQKIEDAAVAQTGRIIEKTDHPLIRMVMELIQRDSQFHHRVQGYIADLLEKEAFKLSPEDLVEVWDMIEEHIKLEKQTVEMAQEALAALKGRKLVAQEYLLHYLLQDEEKHAKLLADLEVLKRGMYPYG